MHNLMGKIMGLKIIIIGLTGQINELEKDIKEIKKKKKY